MATHKSIVFWEHLQATITDLWDRMSTGLASKANSINGTYSELKALQANGGLVAGTWYRMTDFVTTVANDPEARSAGHSFDLLLLATSANSFSKLARAIQHAGDTYFSSADLAAWQVWYDIENDTTRYQWADENNGKGVIFRLIDEWGNDCPYDFKNVQFKRYLTSGQYFDETIQSYDWTNTAYLLAADMSNSSMDYYGNDYVFVYTFTKGSDTDLTEVTDASLIASGMQDLGSAYGNLACRNNTMKAYTSTLIVDEAGYVQQLLNNIAVIVVDEGDDKNVKIYGNHWDAQNYNFTILEHAYGNKWGVYCSNFIAVKCHSNTFGNNCHSNTFGNNCHSNTFGNECHSNTFGNECHSNTFGNECHGNTFGNNCHSNTFGNNCYGNTFGNECHYLTVFDCVAYVSVIDDVKYAQILNGTKGIVSSYLTIPFDTSATYSQMAGLDSGGALKTWTSANNF